MVQDSKEGWAKSLRKLISLLYVGDIPKWDLSKIRPAGARLKTFGGRASGPEPLNDLFNFVGKFKGAAGRKLNSVECHDIMCKIGEVVVVGGVRRSAMINLSNLSDDRMRHAKSGQWWKTKDSVPWLTTLLPTLRSPTWKHSCVSGQPWLSLSQVSVVSSAVMQQTNVARGRREIGRTGEQTLAVSYPASLPVL